MKPSAKKAVVRSTAKSAAERQGILLVDDHPMMRAGLAQLIDRQPDMRVCGQAGRVGDVFRLLPQLEPDLVIADLVMPGRSGLEFIKDLVALRPELPILVFSMHDESLYAERCLRAGARGYLMKEAGSEQLLQALRRVLGGQIHVSPAVSERILRQLSVKKPRGSDAPIQTLSDREFEVFQHVGMGRSTRDIAAQLHLSPKTVDVHRGRIREKLGLKNATELIRHAVQWLAAQQPVVILAPLLSVTKDFT